MLHQFPCLDPTGVEVDDAAVLALQREEFRDHVSSSLADPIVGSRDVSGVCDASHTRSNGCHDGEASFRAFQKGNELSHHHERSEGVHMPMALHDSDWKSKERRTHVIALFILLGVGPCIVDQPADAQSFALDRFSKANNRLLVAYIEFLNAQDT